MLLANQLADLSFQLTSKVANDKKHAPKWRVTVLQVDEKTTHTIVDEFAPLLSLIETLRKLANHHDHSVEEPTMSMVPDFEEPSK